MGSFRRSWRRPELGARTILISGAGVAGPCLGWWLSEYGFQPTLVERAAAPRTGGYVIDFWGLGYDIAERMGLLPALREHAYKVRELRIENAQGRRIGGFGVDVIQSLTDGRYLTVSRGMLAKLLLDLVQSRAEVIFGDMVTGIAQRDGGAEVSFRHGSPRRFDLVVGADGLHSVVRRLVFGDDGRFEKYLGYMVAAFETSGYKRRLEGAYVSYARPGKQIARFALREDRTVFLLVWASENPVEAHSIEQQRHVLHSVFGGAGWECPEILAELDRCEDLYFDTVSQVRLDQWSSGRVTLVGDAAFAPSLLAGQGSALAMISAYVLAGELGRAGGDAAEAFPRYEALLRRFIEKKQRAATMFARAFAPRTEAGLWFRNQVTRMMSLPYVPRVVFGPSLLDRIELPHYPAALNQ